MSQTAWPFPYDNHTYWRERYARYLRIKGVNHLEWALWLRWHGVAYFPQED